ncbi:hypothetical protein PsorP6_012545 [Peronosclerospora sorghi]|uniref:Uncharacterized protein n=1 Tax=Peronosclerospora sorghi TaxID=230839 RepID=A0ACC0WHP7_9STRA|nr:hypothetical protein PsorP6_012545 [Peronosclerospora sorghi]
MHECEKQIAKLYEENKQEKLKNGILKECLRQKNHVKPKVMKSCKHVKQKLQDARDSGLRQVLVDIEARCNMFEKENIRLANELLSQRSLIAARKSEMLQQTKDQIYELQVTIENLNADLKLSDRKTARSTIHCR